MGVKYKKISPPGLPNFSPLSLLSLSVDGSGAWRSTGEDAAAACPWDPVRQASLFPSLYPLSWLPPLHPTQCRSWGRILDVADLEAMSRRDSNEGCSTAGTVDTAFASLRSTEVSPCSSLHRSMVLRPRQRYLTPMEEEDWIRRIHDMEAPRVHDPREIGLQCSPFNS